MIVEYPWGDWPQQPYRPGSPFRDGRPERPCIPFPNPLERNWNYPPCNGIHVDPAFVQSPEFKEAKEKYDIRIAEEFKKQLEEAEAEKKRKAEEKQAKEKEKRRQLFEELKKEFENEQ